MGIIKYPDLLKSGRWKFFFGAECLFAYLETTGKFINYYETHYGIGLITGAEFKLSKHLSLTSHTNPMYDQSNYKYFLKTEVPLVFRELSYPREYHLSASKFWDIELNYKF